MSAAHDSLVSDTRQFLRQLARDNTRAWFAANKPRYDDRLKAPALILLDEVAANLQRMTGAPVQTKLFRPQRDVRFSKDKTPYHLHLHLLWSQGAGKPGWFFGIAPDYVSAGAGFMGFDKAALTAWRDSVAGPSGAGLVALLQAQAVSGVRISEPELKRVPAPYDKNHPQADLLRRKSLTLWQDMQDPQKRKGDLTEWIMAAFTGFSPVINALRPLL